MNLKNQQVDWDYPTRLKFLLLLPIGVGFFKMFKTTRYILVASESFSIILNSAFASSSSDVTGDGGD